MVVKLVTAKRISRTTVRKVMMGNSDENDRRWTVMEMMELHGVALWMMIMSAGFCRIWDSNKAIILQQGWTVLLVYSRMFFFTCFRLFFAVGGNKHSSKLQAVFVVGNKVERDKAITW
ncbi:unnamed protein product [Vicia faba]|uniref:Transmembrane protein n=1 Tax=Vicia faba TaxID=3906 RepID=A0AAV1A5G8_VICFA|nr:unnamed protein product [Vicia faba]